MTVFTAVSHHDDFFSAPGRRGICLSLDLGPEWSSRPSSEIGTWVPCRRRFAPLIIQLSETRRLLKNRKSVTRFWLPPQRIGRIFCPNLSGVPGEILEAKISSTWTHVDHQSRAKKAIVHDALLSCSRNDAQRRWCCARDLHECVSCSGAKTADIDSQRACRGWNADAQGPFGGRPHIP